MCEALNDHEGSVSLRGRRITNFRFADGIVVNAEEEEEAGVLVDHLLRAGCGMRLHQFLIFAYLFTLIEPPQGTKWRLVQTRQK